METVIPARDHGPSTYRYTWDENGEVAQVTRFDTAQSRLNSGIPLAGTHRVSEEQEPQQQQQGQHPSSPEPLTRRARQSIQWPFQSIALDPEIPSPTHQQQQGRITSTQSQYSAWRPPNQHHRASSNSRDDQGDNSPSEQDIVPDYATSFLRGETPPSQFQLESGTSGGATYGTSGRSGVVDIVANHRYQQHRSRVADFEGFRLSDDSLVSPLGRVESREAHEEQRFLAGEKEKTAGGGLGSGWKGLTVGWRGGVALNVLVMFVMLIVGFVCLVVAISRDSLAVFVGSCPAARRVDWGLHAVISVFAVVLVAGANYVFQVLSSPTREEVAAAHQERKWLDIGIPSLRNLGRIERGRIVLAVVVLSSAVFAQIMYNAVIFVSQTAPNYKAAVVTESFLNGAAFSTSTNNAGGLSRHDLSTLQQQAGRNELIRLAAPACIDQFGGAFETDYSAVLLISNLDSPTPLVQTSRGANTTAMTPLTSNYSIQYCLAQLGPLQTCEVNLNAPLLGVVALLNSTVLVATAAALFKRTSFRPLATLGDAISSFLEEPDTTTQNACLLSKIDIRRGRWPPTEAKYWVPRNHYWLRTVSLSRWLITICIWAACVALTAAALSSVITNDPLSRLSPFGTPSPHALILLPATTPPAAAAVLASLPQLLLAILYLAVNALLSTYFLSHESSHFATGPVRPLRVSADLIGAQTTSLHLALPHAVSFPLILLFTAMAFTLRHSLFAVSIHLTDPDTPTPEEITDPALVALGLSGVALLALLAMLVLLALTVLALGLRRAPAVGLVNGEAVGNPMALPGGSCSAVISARCHPLAREKGGLAGREVMWGVVREGVGLGESHCGFTAGRAGVVEAGRNYA